MIPKIIHFCWLSNDEYPEDVKKCMATWSEKLKGYEVIKWDTKRFDVNLLQFTKEAFEAHKYAFVSDYIRLYAVYNYGGIYLDSDIEVLKTFDELLNEKAFTGFESESAISAWIFGSEKGNPLFKTLLDYYKDKPFIRRDGSMDITPNPVPITKELVKKGLVLDNSLQHLDDITIFPMDYFCPYNPYRKEKLFSDNTFCNHHFNGAWKGEEERYIEKMEEKTKRFLPKWLYGYVARYLTVVKYKGIIQANRQVFGWLERKHVRGAEEENNYACFPAIAGGVA